MALTKCPDCGSEISTEAPSCPKCGRPNAQPKKTSPMAAGCGVIVLAVIAVGVFGAIFSDDNSNSNASGRNSSSASPTPAEKPVNLNDAQSLDEKYGIEATSACSVYADDYLRKIAKYDFKWDDIGFLDQKFDKYLKKVSRPGVITMVSDKAKLQNGFGAYQHIELFCDYDTQSNMVSRFWTFGE